MARVYSWDFRPHRWPCVTLIRLALVVYGFVTATRGPPAVEDERSAHEAGLPAGSRRELHVSEDLLGPRIRAQAIKDRVKIEVN